MSRRGDLDAVLAAARRPGQTVQTIADSTGLPVKTVHGHLAALALAGLVRWKSPRSGSLVGVPEMAVAAVRRRRKGAAA